jgi:hypothetical protein
MQVAIRQGRPLQRSIAVSLDAHGYPSAPRIYTAEQIAGWRDSGQS